MERSAINSFISLDKSWLIRMGVLDLLGGHDDCRRLLEKQTPLSDDLQALLGALQAWETDKPIDVGESGTLYRFLQFASWKQGLGKRFILHGTLKRRAITQDDSIVGLKQLELLKLDNCTSQWASAATLLGDPERLPDAPFKLKLTYEAIDHWKQQQKAGKHWAIRRDSTIERQATEFLDVLAGKSVRFVPEQAEDYCFARAFGVITAEEGEQRWPSLRGHETDRIKEMETALAAMTTNKPIDSADHRVIQAIAMKAATEGKPLRFMHPDAVNKSWPEFWDFLEPSRLRQQSGE